jgi:hypothetical protein
MQGGTAMKNYIDIFNYKIVFNDKYLDMYYRSTLQKRYTYTDLLRKVYMDNARNEIFPEYLNVDIRSIIDDNKIDSKALPYFYFDYKLADVSDIFKNHPLYEMARIYQQPTREEMKQALRDFVHKVNPASKYETYFRFFDKVNKLYSDKYFKVDNIVLMQTDNVEGMIAIVKVNGKMYRQMIVANNKPGTLALKNDEEAIILEGNGHRTMSRFSTYDYSIAICMLVNDYFDTLYNIPIKYHAIKRKVEEHVMDDLNSIYNTALLLSFIGEYIYKLEGGE